MKHIKAVTAYIQQSERAFCSAVPLLEGMSPALQRAFSILKGLCKSQALFVFIPPIRFLIDDYGHRMFRTYRHELHSRPSITHIPTFGNGDEQVLKCT